MWYGLCVCVNVYVYVYVGCTYVDARSKFFILMWKTFLIQPELPSFQGQGFFFLCCHKWLILSCMQGHAWFYNSTVLFIIGKNSIT